MILRIEGKEVNTFAELTEELGLFSPGDSVDVEFVRDGHTRTVKAQLLNIKGTTDILR